ncbi:MAG: hypothetical protein ACXVCP_17345 [Bdellovibrio sp.]
MKKNIIYVILSFFVSLQASALTDIETTGEVDMAASVWNLPTGERGVSAFGVPSLFLNFGVPLKENNFLDITLEGSEQKLEGTDRFMVQVRHAYLDVVSPFENGQVLRLGLIPHPWQEAVYEFWPYRFLGRDAWTITEKWKYLNYSDMGLSYISELPQDFGEWSITLTNGEGINRKETGPHKDAFLFARFSFLNPWSLSLGYARGNYEAYGEHLGLKERIHALLVYEQKKSWTVGLEYLEAKDPADAIDANMVEGVQVTSLLGQAVKGQGGSFFTIISTGPKAELMLRYDYMNAVTDVKGKDLHTIIASLGYQVSDDIKAALSADYTKYGDDYALGFRDRSKIELATQVLF